MSRDVQIWRLPQQCDVEFIHVVRLTTPLPRQVSFACKLVYFEQGAKRFRYRRNGYTATAGDLLLIPLGETHEANASEDASTILRILQFPEEAIIDFAPEKCIPWNIVRCFDYLFASDPTVIRCFRQLHRKPETFVSSLEQQTRLIQLLECLQMCPTYRESTVSGQQHEEGSVRCLQHYIEAHYSEEISLAQLAQMTALNPAYLCRVFKNTTGMPPHAYQVAIRIDRARALLRQGLPIGQVAQQTGFYDQAHFTRHFRRLVQISPAQYAA